MGEAGKDDETSLVRPKILIKKYNSGQENSWFNDFSTRSTEASFLT